MPRAAAIIGPLPFPWPWRAAVSPAAAFTARPTRKACSSKTIPVQVADLVATLYRKLGIDPEKEYISNIGRPVKIGNNGKPLEFLMV